MNNFFDRRDRQACLEAMAGDMVWITPSQMYHFLSREEEQVFLNQTIGAGQKPRFVDVLSIKWSPSAEGVSTVAYEINLVNDSQEHSVYLRCSMCICGSGQHLEVTFLHMSERKVTDDRQQINTFAANLPCGVMFFTADRNGKCHAVYYNNYFGKKLHYSEITLKAKMDADPFFMLSEEDREQIQNQLDAIRGTGDPLTVNVTFFRKDGKKCLFRMIGTPIRQDETSAAYYCVFQEITGFQVVTEQLQNRNAILNDTLQHLPGAVCLLQEERGERKAAFLSREIQELFGCSGKEYKRQIQKNILYGIEMASITRDKIRKTYIDEKPQTPLIGTYPVQRPDGTTRWTEIYLDQWKPDDGTGRRYILLYYIDREDYKLEQQKQYERLEQLSRIRDERAREDLRKSREKARKLISEANEMAKQQVEAAQEKAKNQISVEKAGARKMLDIRQQDFDRRIRKVQEEKKNLERRFGQSQQSYAQKIQDLQQQFRKRILELEDALKAEKVRAEKSEDAVAIRYEQQIRRLDRQIEELSARENRDRQEAETLRTENERRQRQEQSLDQEKDRAYERLQQVLDAGKISDTAAIISMTRDFLGMAEADVHSLREDPFDLPESLDNAMNYALPACVQRNITLSLHKSDNLPKKVAGDKPRLQKVLGTIVESAARYTPRGGTIAASCRMEFMFTGKAYLKFQIRDSGSKIAADVLSGVFDAESSTKDPLRAGLAAARETVGLMGGTIQIRDIQETGSEFVIRVSMKIPQEETDGK